MTTISNQTLFCVIASVCMLSVGPIFAEEIESRESKAFVNSIASLSRETRVFDFKKEPIAKAVSYIHLIYTERLGQIAEAGRFPARWVREWDLYIGATEMSVDRPSQSSSIGEMLSLIAKVAEINFIMDQTGLIAIPNHVRISLDSYERLFEGVYVDRILRADK